MPEESPTETRQFGGGEINVLLRKAVPPETTKGKFDEQ